jgi:outer membrane protein
VFKIFILTLVLFNYGFSQIKNDYSVRILYGQETDSDLGDILFLNNPTEKKYDFFVKSIDFGYKYKKDILDLPLDMYFNSGFSIFNEGKFQDDTYEVTIYMKFYYKFFNNSLRVGVAEGLSYTTSLLTCELLESIEDGTLNNPNKTSKFLNYLDISLDFNVGKLVHNKKLDNLYLGYTIKHRSGIFGLIKGVHGGSNYNSLSLELLF